ncbi:MAG TPA: phosphatase PAP2 family protein [Bacteroidia bacterium]|jgi:membrane-associated phospholipid phosphatase|nr:phosphatase PAP2 family protein [Bacteroidia bacterium]
MKNAAWLILLFLFGITLNVTAQEAAKDSAKKDTSKLKKVVQTIIKDTVPRKETKKDTLAEKKLEKKFYGLPQFEHETFLFIKTPLRWRESDWLRVGVVAATTIAIMPFDQSIANSTQGNQHYYNSAAVIGGRDYGEWYTIGVVTAAFASYGILAKDTAAKKIAIELFQAGAYSELFTEVIKIIVGRARPYENLGPYTYHPFTVLDVGFNSSPSGHATSAFALSTVMSRHAHSTFLKILAYVPAGFTLFSRIYQNFHWASDEFFGGMVGFATGNWVVNLHEGRRHKINLPPPNKENKESK